MLMRIFVFLIVVVALAVGVFSFVLPRDQLIQLSILRDFVDTINPILIFGALIKFLCCGFGNSCCKK